MKRIKNFLFHVNLMYATWKQIRRYPNAKVEVSVHQVIEGKGILKKA